MPDPLANLFRQQGFRGMANEAPASSIIAEALERSHVYLFNGHNAGEAFFPVCEWIQVVFPDLAL
jgi:hypothetical protein